MNIADTKFAYAARSWWMRSKCERTCIARLASLGKSGTGMPNTYLQVQRRAHAMPANQAFYGTPLDLVWIRERIVGTKFDGAGH